MNRLFFALVATASLAAVAAAYVPVTIVTVTGEQGEVLLQESVTRGRELRVGFTHSSEHVQVVTAFRIEAGRLEALRTEMEGFGPGLTQLATPSGQGTLVSTEPVSLSRVTFLVDPSTRHWLQLNPYHLDLSASVPGQRSPYRYTLDVRLAPWFHTWR